MYKIYKRRNNTEKNSTWWTEHTFDFLLQCSMKLLYNQSCHEQQSIFFFNQRIGVFAPSVNSILSLQSERLGQIGSAKSSFPRRVIKAPPSLSQTHCKGKSVAAPPTSTPTPAPPPPPSPRSSAPRHISAFDWRSDRLFGVLVQIQYTRAGSEWATGVGDNTYRHWILRRPGRRAQSRARPHMGT